MKKNQYVIIRTYSAGVFAGYIISRKGKEAVVKDSRRLWRWAGAASLSQLAVEGTNIPSECKFAVPMPLQELTEVIEVIAISKEAEKSIKAVPVWRVY